MASDMRNIFLYRTKLDVLLFLCGGGDYWPEKKMCNVFVELHKNNAEELTVFFAFNKYFPNGAACESFMGSLLMKLQKMGEKTYLTENKAVKSVFCE